MCLAQGPQRSDAGPMRLEPAAPRSQVKYTTTEPLCSPYKKKPLVLIHANNTGEFQCEWIEQAGLLPCHSLNGKYKDKPANAKV